MKSLSVAAAVAAIALCAAPAFAQSVDSRFYGTLGYSNFSDDPADLSAITGRLGARLSRFMGVEGEVSGGLGSDSNTIAGIATRAHLNDQYAGYAVGFLPVAPHLDLFARVGYGHTDWHVTTPAAAGSFGQDSVNYGAGGQYFFDQANGVRAEYTRDDYTCTHCGAADVWSVAYVRKF